MLDLGADLAANRALLVAVQDQVAKLAQAFEAMRRLAPEVDQPSDLVDVDIWSIDGKSADGSIRISLTVGERSNDIDTPAAQVDDLDKSLITPDGDGAAAKELGPVPSVQPREAAGAAADARSLVEIVLEFFRSHADQEFSVRRVGEALGDRSDVPSAGPNEIREAMLAARQLDPQLQQVTRKSWAYRGSGGNDGADRTSVEDSKW